MAVLEPFGRTRPWMWLLGLCLSVGFTNGSAQYDAVVDPAYNGTEGFSQAGTPTFRSIGAALVTVPRDSPQSFRILIRKGFYDEKLLVDRPNVTLIGEDRDATVISHDDSGDTLGSDGRPLGTWGSYTIKVIASDFRAENLTIENRFDYPGNAAKSEEDPSKVANPKRLKGPRRGVTLRLGKISPDSSCRTVGCGPPPRFAFCPPKLDSRPVRK